MAVGVVLGSGLGSIADEVSVENIIEYSQVNPKLRSTVSGHMGRFLVGKLDGIDVVVMQGRIHYYEGYTSGEIVSLIDYMVTELSVDKLILTNAAGAINESFAPGDIAIITDHISSLVPSPLIGVDLTERTGSRFHDMTNVYSKDGVELIRSISDRLGISVKEGVYLQTTGPNYETPAEIRAYKSWGADLVGMSTAIEALYANALGIKVCGLSCVTNMAAGLGSGVLSHDEVKETADKTGSQMKMIVRELVRAI